MAFMAPPITKTSDSPVGATSETQKAPEQHNNLLDLMDGAKKNALAPAVNSFGVEPLNVGVNVLNGGLEAVTWLAKKGGYEGQAPQVGKVAEMETGKPAEGSVGAWSQQIFGTAGSFAAYALAGKVAGKVMRTGAQIMPLELEIKNLKVGSITRGLAQDTRIATVLGATAYAGLKDTKDGESHFSNAASTFIGFAAFEGGNSLIVNPRANALLQTTQRFTVGMAGGLAQTNVASIIQEHKFASNDLSSMAAGGVLNALMPAGRRGIDEIAARNPLVKVSPHASDAATRLHIEAAKALPKGQAPEPGSWADPKALAVVTEAAKADLHLRVKTDAPGSTRIDQTRNLVHLEPGGDPLSLVQEIAHRQAFKDPKFEKAFESHASEIQSKDPADRANAGVKEKYIQTRLDQEIAARTAQNEAAAKLGSPNRVSVDAAEIRTTEGYGARFEQEANDFIRSGGKSRPEFDYSAGKDAVVDSRRVAGKVEHSFTNTKEAGADHTRFTQKLDGTKVHIGYESQGQMKVDFPSGRVHTVNLGEPINRVRVVVEPDGVHNYYFNGRGGDPQLTVDARYNEMKVLPANGDKILITGVDHHGADLEFPDGVRVVLSGRGVLTVTAPGRPSQTVELGATPGRFAVVERADGSKLFQLADAAASRQTQIKLGPTIVPRAVVFKPHAAVAPPPQTLAKNPPKFARPPSQIQGTSTGGPASHTYFESEFPDGSAPAEDRYPLRANIWHDPVRELTGIDQRALPGREMDTMDIMVAKMELPYPLEDHFAQLGRHHDDNQSWFPW